MEKLNIIWIVVDNMRYDSFSGRYDANATTPNIDNLCRNGKLFKNTYTSGGRDMWLKEVLGATRNRYKSNPQLLSKFKHAKYNTMWVGKGISTKVAEKFNCYVCKEDSALEVCELFGNKLEKIAQNPFFAVIALDALCSRANLSDKSYALKHNVPSSEVYEVETQKSLACYYANLKDIDLTIGLIREKLKAYDVDKKTIIMLISSGGNMLGSHGYFTDDSFYNECIHIPFVVATLGGGARIKVGESDSLITNKDIFKATLAMSKISKRTIFKGIIASEVDKFSMLKLLQSRKKHLVLSSAKSDISPNKEWRALVSNKGIKYICHPNFDAYLFNLNSDKDEMTNISFDVSEILLKAKMHNKLKIYLKTHRDKFKLPKKYL